MNPHGNNKTGQVKFLRLKAVQNLLNQADRDPNPYSDVEGHDWRLYQDTGSFAQPWFIDSPNSVLPSSDSLINTLKNSKCNPASDAEDSLAIYNALQQLTPQQAADPRLWVGLTHFELYEYVRRRWNSPLDSNDDVEKRRNYIRNHWFVRGNRGLYRDNGASRLWWMGRIITLIAEDSGLDQHRVGELLLKMTDVRANLIERTSTASNIRLAAEITLTLDLYSEEPRIFNRQVFRTWMIELNRLGGTILLDALGKPRLRKIVRQQAEKALLT